VEFRSFVHEIRTKSISIICTTSGEVSRTSTGLRYKSTRLQYQIVQITRQSNQKLRVRIAAYRFAGIDRGIFWSFGAKMKLPQNGSNSGIQVYGISLKIETTSCKFVGPPCTFVFRISSLSFRVSSFGFLSRALILSTYQPYVWKWLLVVTSCNRAGTPNMMLATSHCGV
jgi:hypothetical protein